MIEDDEGSKSMDEEEYINNREDGCRREERCKRMKRRTKSKRK